MSEPNSTDRISRTFLVADIGGTNSRVGVSSNGTIVRGSIRKFLNSDFGCFEEIVADYRNRTALETVDGVCVAVAGPVEHGRSRMTNINWTIDAGALDVAAECRRSAIINDLEAMGHALHMVDGANVVPVISAADIRNSPVRPTGKKLLVNVGTGFNIATVIRTPSGCIVSDSECGRVTLPVRTAQDYELKCEIETLSGYAGLEDILSGRGVKFIHSWVCRQDAAGPTPDCSSNGPLFQSTPEWRATGRILARILGIVVGDMALLNLPTQGIFLVGGVACGLAPHLAEFGMEAAFIDKGDYTKFMRKFPVSVITDDVLALRGCAAYSRSLPD